MHLCTFYENYFRQYGTLFVMERIYMHKKKEYPGIDYFRLIAALLVIAIHTSPLTSYHETADFILTRIIARIAVPFFIMTTGFFTLCSSARNTEKYDRFIHKTFRIYVAAMLFYLPINIYNGYFQIENFLPNLLKDLVFDGTLYHLWYLPASLIGAAIARHLLNRCGAKRALIISLSLYLIGLFGDSYYGISANIAILKNFYTLLFQIMDYTRNGIFFTPLFFVLGALTADKWQQMPYPVRGGLIVMSKNICGFTVSLLLMLTEALLLHHDQLQRHDSMYLFLPPCMYFLFRILLLFRGKSPVWLRTGALLIYIIHPMVIVLLRLSAKILCLEDILIENSLIHYLSVAIFSVLCSMILSLLYQKYSNNRFHTLRTNFMSTRHTSSRQPNHCSSVNNAADRAYVEINLQNLKHNAEVLKKAMPTGTKLMAVIKADAYGHGACKIAECLNRMGVDAFAVATIEEGIALRKHGICGEILILGYTAPYRAAELKHYDLIQTLIDFEYAQALNRQHIMIKAHIKIDTGMHRLGIPAEDVLSVRKIFSMRNILVCGIYTHLCCADSLLPDDIAFTHKQIDRFYSAVRKLKKAGIKIPKLHIQSSYGLLNYPDLKCDYVRCGIALYGVLCKPNDKTVLDLDLRPVLSLKSKVILIRCVEKGESIGYGRSFVTGRKSRIAILPIGYADGFPRNLSCGMGSVLIRGHKAPVVGRICMDQLAVDVTDIEGVLAGDIATLIGTDENSALPAPNIAECSGSISNELLCRIGNRVGRNFLTIIP